MSDKLDVQRSTGLPSEWRDSVVEMKHGSGGSATSRLIEQIFHRHFNNDYLAQGNDFALLSLGSSQCAMSTDSFVISPLFFPGGDIGSLSVHGTVNDLAMSGYQPKFLSAGFILEEGFPLAHLDKIVKSMAAAAREAGVMIVTGDTKVVEKGKADGVFINTAGIAVPYGEFPAKAHFGGAGVKRGDAVIISGTIGDHGVAVMAQREGLSFETSIESDSAPLVHLIKSVLDTGADIHCLRDPTRGGLASTLNEIAVQSNVSIQIDEALIPLHPQVNGACELLGLDPLYVANEGKVVCICSADSAEKVVAAMQTSPYGHEASIIGWVDNHKSASLVMKTKLGGLRLVDTLDGEQLPRIC